MENFAAIETDVLVVGSEAAGARAAIAAADCGADVILVTKNIMGKSGVTLKAVFSFSAALGLADPEDSPDEHFRDIVEKGRWVSDQGLVELVTYGAQECVEELARWGLNWDKEGGRYRQVKMYGHSRARSLSIGYRPGVAIMRVLKKETLGRQKIRLMDEVFVTNYLVSASGWLTGAFGIDIKTGGLLLFKTKAVVDATGGAMYLYEHQCGTPESTGDGLAMALRAGAELVDMEFVQFHPTVLLSPLALRGNQGVLYLARVLLRGVMLNAKGERFLERYDPERMELTDRDIMARAIHREVMEGRGSPNGGVWLDVSHMGDAEVEARVRKFAPKWVFRGINLLEYGLDLRRVPLEIGPFAHFWCGGIKVGPGMGTRVNGLFASGEAIGGVFGANRMPGDALVQAVVTGKTAGISAAEYAKGSSSPGEDGESVKAEAHRALSFLRDGKGARPHRIRKSLRRLMMQKVGVVRNEGGLKEALAELARIREEDLPRIALRTKSRKYNREWVESLELQNMLEVAEMTANPALRRNETRGNHEREDYVETSRDWLKNIVIRSSGGKLELEEIPCSFPRIAPE